MNVCVSCLGVCVCLVFLKGFHVLSFRLNQSNCGISEPILQIGHGVGDL